MASVYLGLGSNQQASVNIKRALAALAERFKVTGISPVYESESVGFEGDNFLNLVVAVTTELSIAELLAQLRAIEDAQGRDRTLPRFASRTLDIDILTYDNAVGTIDGVSLPRDEILKNAFVLQPLADLAPEAIHPEVNKSYQQLWNEYDSEKQKLWRVELV